MEQFLKKFELDIPDISALPTEQAYADLESRGDDILNFEKLEIFTYMKDDIARIRDEIAKDKDNLLYSYLLAAVFRSENNELRAKLSRPCQEAHSELYDTLPLFALLDLVPDMVAKLKSKNVPEDIIHDTCMMFENQIQDFVDKHHHYGISDYVSWMMYFIRCKIVRIGRFNLEVATYNQPYDVFECDGKLQFLPKGVTFHRSGQILGSAGCEDETDSFVGNSTETDTEYIGTKIENGRAVNETIHLPKDKWQKLISYGDPIIDVHIPSGGPLDPETCDRDFARGREVFKKCFGDFKGFCCNSWLLDPQIKTLLGKETNLTRFADRFTRLPIESTGTAPYGYIWKMPPSVPAQDLPEPSTLARVIKAHMVGGGYIYGSYGVFL